MYFEELLRIQTTQDGVQVSETAAILHVQYRKRKSFNALNSCEGVPQGQTNRAATFPPTRSLRQAIYNARR